MSLLDNKNRKLNSLLAEQRLLTEARDNLEQSIATITDRLTFVKLDISIVKTSIISYLVSAAVKTKKTIKSWKIYAAQSTDGGEAKIIQSYQKDLDRIRELLIDAGLEQGVWVKHGDYKVKITKSSLKTKKVKKQELE